ncbi:phosphoribosylaminoimidazolesuccinocarboxamide synthase [SAR86 cluster bacterium]|nr:phosphoribosylaminoimidazolesuccinocarboxamide synthase [SAR86 cluster bacterium]
MEKIEILKTGKAKALYTTSDPSKLIMEYRDDTSAFDGKKIEQLAGKGTVNNRFNGHIMDHLQSKGVDNHHIEATAPNESIVMSLDMFPIECVVRNFAAGSICKRLGLEEAMVMEPPIFEFFYKDDSLGDPLINDCHITAFGWANEDDIEVMKELTLKTNDILVTLFDSADLILVDFKLEFGKSDGKIYLGDEFTPDGCRVWDKETKKKLDKDRFRLGLGDVVESYQEIAHRLGINLT